MLASKSEKDALGAVLFFNVAHYVLRPWPWIIVALASILVYPQLSDIQTAFPHLDPSLIGHDIAYPAMLKFLPGRLHRPDGRRPDRGQLVDDPDAPELGGVVPGARLLPPLHQARTATEKHYVAAGRVATVILFVCSSGLVFVLDTAKDAFDVILQIGAGTGLLYLIRWFWWRVNAWCEVAAMVTSFAVSLVILIMARNGIHMSTHIALIVTIAVTTVCWVVTAFLGPETDRETLVSFYKKVRPFGPGWERIRIEAGIGRDEKRTSRDNIPLALVGWVSGCTVIWAALFTVGNFLYGRTGYALGLFAVFVGSGAVLIYVINQLWPEHEAAQQP